MPSRRTFLIRHVRSQPAGQEELGRYLLQWRTKDLYADLDSFPKLTAEALFGKPGPLSLEIGCGTGEYICGLAQSAPDACFLGTDINLKSLEVAVGNAIAQSVDNVRFIKAPMQWLYPLMPDSSLQTVYVHFPDPSLHPKYRKRRLLNETFMDNIHRALVPGGLLSLVTDNADLLDLLLPLVEADHRFERLHPERYMVGFEPAVKSRYQLYWEKHSKPIFRVLLTGV